MGERVELPLVGSEVQVRYFERPLRGVVAVHVAPGERAFDAWRRKAEAVDALASRIAAEARLTEPATTPEGGGDDAACSPDAVEGEPARETLETRVTHVSFPVGEPAERPRLLLLLEGGLLEVEAAGVKVLTDPPQPRAVA